MKDLGRRTSVLSEDVTLVRSTGSVLDNALARARWERAEGDVEYAGFTNVCGSWAPSPPCSERRAEESW
jgi:hypothetical protein